MKEKEYCVYAHINKNDDYKAYIGITKDTKKRWRNGQGYVGQDKFYNAIKKYGWKNFKHIVLLNDLTIEEAWKKEKEYIKIYDSINDGYNVHEGGKIVITEEMRKKGHITQKLKSSGLIIASTKYLKYFRYSSVKEASLKTGISEHWFYRYYRNEVNLENYEIYFDIDRSNKATKIYSKEEKNLKIENKKTEMQIKFEKDISNLYANRRKYQRMKPLVDELKKEKYPQL